MADHSENSSSNVILALCAALIAIVGGGWFLLDSEGDAPTISGPRPTLTTGAIPAEEPDSGAEPTADADDPTTEPPGSEPVATTEQAQPIETVAPTTVDSDLRKARLAAEADILVDPAEQSALYYYGRVLAAEPGHEVANAELNEVLGRLAMTTTDLLTSERYSDALELADKVSAVRPDHALVNQVQQTLNQLSGEFVTNAMQYAENGDDSGATEALASAEALPGRNAEYIEAVRESINDLLREKANERAEIVETERANAARETADWMARVRDAIAAGNLVGSDDDSAQAALAERGDDDEIAGQLREELLSAVLANASTSVFEGDLDTASSLATAAREIDPESTEVTDLLAAIDRAYITQESARVLPVTELVRLTNVRANYPRRAEERGISGWVEVVFTVSTSGQTEDVTVTGAEPPNIFNSAATNAVAQWTFQPRVYRGQPIPQRATARLVFRLQDQ